MSAVFDLDTEGQGALAEQAKVNGISIDQLQAGFFQGVPKAIGMGVMRGGARAAQAVGLAGGGLLSLMEDHPGDLTDPYFKALDQYVGNAVDYWTPGANEVGTAGRILGGFSEMALPLMATGGNPALLIGTAELGGAQDLAKQGASTAGAVAGGIVQGAATAVGFKIPFLGKTLATKLASGLVGNVGAGVGGRLAEKGALSLTGNAEQAAQIHPFDAESLAVDALTGLAFGGIAHGFSKLAEHAATPSVRDSVATVANAKHFQQDTAPGIPADITSSIAHQDAMESAIRATLEGKPVDLSGSGVMDADFIALPRPFGHLAEVPEELKGVDEALKPDPTHAEQIAAADLPKLTRAQLAQHYEQAAEAKPAFDAAVREISQETGTPHEPNLPALKKVERAAEKTMADYGGDATKVKDLVRGTIVADTPQQIQIALDGIRLHFGEPIGLRNHLTPDSPPVNKEGYRDIKANVLVNGHMSEVQVNVPEMLAAKKQAHPFYKQDRAISAKAELENRDVTPAENARQIKLRTQQAKIYAAAWDSFLTRSRNTDSDTKVPLWAKDEEGNRRPSGTSQARQTPSGVSEQGTPSTSAKSVPAGNEAGSDIANTSSRSIPETGPNSSDPVIRAAFQALTEADFQVPTGEIDANGNPVYRSARELMAESEADVAQAKNDAKGFDALVGCILTNGDG